MLTDALDRLLRTLQVRLDAFGVCEIERGWRLKSAPMKSPTLHCVLKGEGGLECGASRVPIGPGAIVVIPAAAQTSFVGPGEIKNEVGAYESCALRADGLASFRAGETQGDLVMACAAVSATSAGGYGLFDRLSDPIVEHVEASESFGPAFAAMLEEFSKPQAGAVTLAEALMKQCLVLMLRSHVERFGLASPFLAHLVDERLARAVDLMVSTPAASHSLDSLAAAAAMSRSAFATRFRSTYGRTPFEFLHAVRLEAAARLLVSAELPVKVVAATVGYSSRSYFSRAFRAAYGIDPSHYRDLAARTSSRAAVVVNAARTEGPTLEATQS